MNGSPLTEWLATNCYWPMQWQVLSRLCQILERHMSGEKLPPAEIEAAVANRSVVANDYQVVNGTAVIPVSGVIAKYARQVGGVSQPRGTSVERMRGQLHDALADESVDRIVLDIESPGGNIAGLADFADEVYAANQRKPVVAFANDLAASAAYWIGAQAGQFVANRSAEIGSIGVYTVLVDDSRAAENKGVRVLPISSGAHKTTGMPGAPITTQQIEAVQTIVNDYADQFFDAVLRGRAVTLTRETLEPLADGRTWTAPEALKLGLIDGITTLDALLSSYMEDSPMAETQKVAAKVAAEETVDVAALQATAAEEAVKAERARIAALAVALPGDALADVRAQAVEQGLTVDAAKALAFDALQAQLADMQAKLSDSEKRLKVAAESGETVKPQADSDEEAEVVDGKPDDTPDSEKTPEQLEAAAKAAWDADKQLQAEFGEFAIYHAYRKAVADGRITE